MHPTFSRLLAALDVQALGGDVFTGPNEAGRGRLFGGQVIAQSLRAASLTLPEAGHARIAHSLHAYFVRGGERDEPVSYGVERVRDGGSFSVRRVTARQASGVICCVDASFHRPEQGLAHAVPMPAVPPPEALPGDVDAGMDAALAAHPELARPRHLRPFEMRPVHRPGAPAAGGRFDDPVWVRPRGPVPDDDGLRRCLLAYASDMGVVSTGALPHGLQREHGNMSSLDHALWLHATPAFDDWLLFVKQTSWGGGGRVLNGARFYTRDGRLLATVAQEGLIRVADAR
jgi:acyl-CoA thioesterase-2